jgi:hypothetical protein
MKLYMHPVSTATRPVRLFIAENGIKCDEEMVDILRGAHYQKPYASLNPNRLVPMLEDGVLCLTESSAQKPNCTNSVVLDKSTRHGIRQIDYRPAATALKLPASAPTMYLTVSSILMSPIARSATHSPLRRTITRSQTVKMS